MNLKQLEVFLAVAESGSFSRGAEATFLTQSTVSQHIAALENEVGVRLLDRTSRGALLTEGGKSCWSTPGKWWRAAARSAKSCGGSGDLRRLSCASAAAPFRPTT